MPRFANYPDTIESCLTISTTNLKVLGFLTSNQSKEGTISVSRNGQVFAQFNIKVIMGKDYGSIAFDYKTGKGHNRKHIKYTAQIISIPTNIGNGLRYYFVCPSTGKYALKLYMASGSDYFVHREAYNGLMYQSQLSNRNWRFLDKTREGYYLKLDMLYAEYYRKGTGRRKRYYKGVPTKAYQKILDTKKLAEGALTLRGFGLYP